MKNTADFIEALKAKHGLKSNYAVAKFLNQTDTAVARWAHGKGSFSDENAMQIADLLDLDPAYVVACIHAERAKRKEEKALWAKIAERMAVAAAVMGVAVLAPHLGGDPALLLAGFTSGTMRVMSNNACAVLAGVPAAVRPLPAGLPLAHSRKKTTGQLVRTLNPEEKHAQDK